MMRKHYLLLAAPLLLGSFATRADELAAPLAQCIQQNAPRVEKTVTSLTDATSFLVDDVCAVEATAEIQRQRLVKYKEMRDQQTQQNACEAKAGVDTNARSACITQSPENAFATLSQFIPTAALPANKVLPEATSYAANELLKLRLSHANSGN